MNKNIYKEDSIKTLDAREHVRLRVGNYTGGTVDSTHLVREIFYNSQDEHEIGHGNNIIVNYNTIDNIISVEDEAQGFPVGVTRDDGKTIFQAAADTLNTSGKFSGEVYNNNVTGLNGQGLKITNFLSVFLDAYTANGTGKAEHLYFKNGVLESREYINVPKEQHGTIIKWKPDPSFFQDEHVNINSLKQLFKECAALHPQLTIEFIVDNIKETYQSKGGINTLLDDLIKGKEILSNRFFVSKSTSPDIGSDRLDIAITYTSDYSEKIVPYVNAALTESGMHITYLKTLFTQVLNKYARQNNLIKEKDSNLSGAELSEGLVIVFNLKATGVDYTGQAKEKVSNIDTSLINSVINNEFVDWLTQNSKDAKAIIDKALVARRAKEAAQKAKDGIRNAGTKGKKFISLPSKLLDAFSKNREETELFICEGNSALNGLASTRDGRTQALFPIRGKILNCSKATPDKVYANAEVASIVKALGLDIDKITGKLIYDKKKLRYGKILLTTDADEDAAQIKMLLINMFWWLCPELIVNGHLGAVFPPLFRVTTKKNEYIYLKDHKELDEYKKRHKNESFLLNRMKGYEN